MHTYRYFTTDLLTGEVLGELPLYGVYCDVQMSASGTFTGTFRLGTHIEDDQYMIDATIPRRTAIYIQRDGTTIWGGIIWSRTYESNAKTVQLNGQTFESYLARVLIAANFVRLNANQLQTAKDLIDVMQTDPRADINIDTSQIDTTGGSIVNTAIPWYDFKFVGDAFNELASSEDGFDFTIRIDDTATVDQPKKVLLLGQPMLTPGGSTDVEVYDYPGAIDQFYWPESSSTSGTDFAVLGRGTGSGMLTAYSRWAGSDGYPRLDNIISKKNVSNIGILNGVASDAANTFGPDLTNPTVTLNSDREPEFTAWNDLGTYFQLELEAPRFPERKIVIRRMIGWEFSPASGEQSESVKLRIAGEDND